MTIPKTFNLNVCQVGRLGISEGAVCVGQMYQHHLDSDWT